MLVGTQPDATSVDAGARWELWATVPAPGRRPPRVHLDQCGAFDDEGRAFEVGSLVSRWLRTGTLEARLLREIDDPDGRYDLVGLPDLIARLAYDPRKALVSVRRFGAESDQEPGDGFGR